MSQPDREQELGCLIAEFLKREQRGEPTDREALAAAHPDLAEDLRSFFANHDQMHAAADAALGSQRLGSQGMGLLDSTLEPGGSSGPASSSTLPESYGHLPRKKVGYFGDYELLAEVARGGMGVVYRARQVNLDRVVALKRILAGQLASPEDVRRFYQEAEAAANLEHPGIVPVFEVGQHEGQHFFSMGYVDGPNLAQVLAGGPLSPRSAATLVKLVAEAIAYAHDRGVIHRDLKPANVLLAKLYSHSDQRSSQSITLQAGAGDAHPAGTFQPKVTDFGLAKKAAADEGGLTGTGQILGTPSYMPPEQASGRISDIGTVSDVYSLGAILYATLTGHPPFQSDTPLNIVRQVLEQEPVSPRQLNPAVPRDLETICLKCLEKDRRKRYASARELAEELQRYLAGEPIRARRIGSLERGWRWCRRKPAVAALVTLCAAVLLALCIGGPWLAYKEHAIAIRESWLRQQAQSAEQQAIDERNIARQQRTIAIHERERAVLEQERAIWERERAQRNLAAGQLALGTAALRNNRSAEALNWFLHAYLNAPPGDPMRLGARNIIGAHIDEAPQTVVLPATVHEVAVSSDGKTLWAAYLMSRSQLWNLATNQPIGPPLPHSGDVVSGAFSPDGASLLTSDWRGADVWNAATGQPQFPAIAHANREDTMIAPEFSPDGLTIATRDTLESIRLWDARTGQPRCPSLPLQGEVWRIRFSPDSQWIAAQAGGEVRIWDARTGEAVGQPWTEISDFAFLPEGRTLAVCGKDGKVSLRSVADAAIVSNLEHDEPISRLQLDAAGKNLLGYFFSYQSSPTQTAVVWRNVIGADRSKLVVREGPGLGSAALSPNGEFVALVERGRLRVVQTRDGVSLWSRGTATASPFEDPASFGGIEFSPDSRNLLVRSKGGALIFRAAFESLVAREQNVGCYVFAPDGKRVVFGGQFGVARQWSLESVAPQPVATLEDLKKSRGIQRTSFTTDGRTVVTAGRGKQVQFWDAATWQAQGEPIDRDFPIESMAISPDDKKIALMLTLPKPPMAPLFAPTPNRFELWDAASRTRIGEPIEFPTGGGRITFDATGRTIAIGTALYDAETLQPRRYPADADAQNPEVVKLLWWNGSPSPKLWDDVANAPTRVRLPAPDLVYSKISRTGRLLGQNRQGALRLWDAVTGEALGPLFQIDGAPIFSSDTGRYIVGGQQDAVQIWDTYTGKRCGEQLSDSRTYMVAAFSPTESLLATTKDFRTRLWDCATGLLLGPPMQNSSTGQDDLDFSPDGRWLLSTAGQVKVFRVPQPAIDDPERLRLLVEVRSGLRVDENGTMQILRHEEWLERKTQMAQSSLSP